MTYRDDAALARGGTYRDPHDPHDPYFAAMIRRHGSGHMV
jgi:hypothetical protein